MFVRFHRRLHRQDGFTLIELMVVVMIIGILVAIAIPTFLGLRNRAEDRAAQSDLRSALAAAKVYFADDDTYAGFNAAVGTSAEPALQWSDGVGVPVGDDAVRVETVNGATPTTVVMNADSESGETFCLADQAVGGTVRGRGVATTYASCGLLPPW